MARAVQGEAGQHWPEASTAGFAHQTWCGLCRVRQDTTVDVLKYMGVPEADRERVEEYFRYIIQYGHPAAEGMAFLNELPKPLFEEVTGG